MSENYDGNMNINNKSLYSFLKAKVLYCTYVLKSTGNPAKTSQALPHDDKHNFMQLPYVWD